jgi:hypothetical protein
MNPKNHAPAVKYRQLALAEPDKAKAAVLYENASEAERDVLSERERVGVSRLPRADIR